MCRLPTPTSVPIPRSWCRSTATSCWATIAPCRTTAATLGRLELAISMVRPCSDTGPWIKWEEYGRLFVAFFADSFAIFPVKSLTAKDAKESAKVAKKIEVIEIICFAISASLLKSLKSTPWSRNASYACARRRKSLPRQRIWPEQRRLRRSRFQYFHHWLSGNFHRSFLLRPDCSSHQS